MNKFIAIKKASILGVLANIFLLIIKFFVALITNSQAMLADSFNSASDIFSSIMTFIGNKIASKPSDDDHNLGHGKAEYIYSMLISITMMVLVYNTLKKSILSLFGNSSYHFSIWLIIVCIVTIGIKFILYIYTNKLYKKYDNLLIKANSDDHRNDCLITFVNLCSCFFCLKGLYFIDGIVGIVISLWIFKSACKIFKDSYDVLMDKSIDLGTREKVYRLIFKHPEVITVSHFNSTPVGYQYQISFTIFVDGDLSTFESHEIANKLEREIDETFDEIYLTVVHVNPIKVSKKD